MGECDGSLGTLLDFGVVCAYPEIQDHGVGMTVPESDVFLQPRQKLGMRRDYLVLLNEPLLLCEGQEVFGGLSRLCLDVIKVGFESHALPSVTTLNNGIWTRLKKQV